MLGAATCYRISLFDGKVQWPRFCSLKHFNNLKGFRSGGIFTLPPFKQLFLRDASFRLGRCSTHTTLTCPPGQMFYARDSIWSFIS